MSPQEIEAVAVAADTLDGAGNPVALLVALVAELSRRDRLPENEVAVLLKELNETYPKAVGMTRYYNGRELSKPNGQVIADVYETGFGEWVAEPGSAIASWDTVRRATQDAVEAALFATQPEPRAIIRSPGLLNPRGSL